ncbi:MAG TPA: serine/threonine-protein kinase [Gemmatimonadaceae bacterium]|nr:serine/threonine-protein kinase [Gemmatimonadaceae bacterium]
MIHAGERIGPYRLLRTIGEGGMGVVYEAEQLEPVKRRVALKLLRRGMDTKAFIARFEVERQALAVMDHPNIAHVFDAGSADGRPYYAMELVHGVELTTFCDEHRLTTNERLRIFLDLCSAVHHAHQKGIIHRDLKPSNVLVAMHDDRPTPKVIDFGIAKAIGQRLTELTLVTTIGQPVGTPAYMSPEQWEAQLADVDTRADIYSLGVMLYELLSGSLPYDTAKLLRAGGAAPRLLRDTTPPTPSTRVLTLGDASTSVAEARRTDPRTLARDLRGDLDWIALKAIDPDRRRRYETAHELASDLARHLRAEPVLARPASASYRAGRFLVRHRVGAGVVAAVVLAAVAFTGETAVHARRVAHERDRAAGEAAKVRALNAFLEQTLLSPNPLDGIGKDATMLQALDSAAARLEREPTGSVVVDASVRGAIGRAFFGLGAYDRAEPLLRRALRERESTAASDSSALAESLLQMGDLHRKLGRADSAEVMFERALAIRRALGAADRGLAEAEATLGGFLAMQGDSVRAPALLEAASRTFAALGSPRDVGQVEDDLGILEYQCGHLAAAERHLRIALAQLRIGFGRHPYVAEALANLGVVLEDLHRPRDAEAVYREAIQIAEATLPPDHDIVAAALNDLGVLLSNQGQLGEAERVMRRALAVDERKLGGENPAVGRDLLNLSLTLCREGPSPEGDALAARAGRILAANESAGSWALGQAKVVRGTCLMRLRRLDDAERELRAGRAVLEHALGPSHWRVDTARVRLDELEGMRHPNGG